MVHILKVNFALRKLREQRGISQDKLSELAGLDRTFISLVECGKRKPSLETIDKITRVLNVKTWELLKYIEETNCETKFLDKSI
ncbi:helix-turn-helix transcriptional regulator [Limnoraphis robusta]|uniref:Helix-turn-helix transcriptional regulator n=1 Tax=Limnoraphis robusta CCNP1315 TaxID=3110306 RepID=A0ABU5TY40_9CYAN|nr:helix-turn-helix transcriptional regulator [Limnoraphis robusta]MEA5519630.1 helix-turn-helix transcriptional regulator [Limnoraphis robusta CCNP1315]